MLELAQGFPENVAAVVARGQVTREDYRRVLIPKVEDVLRGHEKARLYYELGAQFSGIDAGAAWEDLKLGIKDFTRWYRIAVVTDVEWIRHTVNAFSFIMPSEVRVFPTARAPEAKSWVATA